MGAAGNAVTAEFLKELFADSKGQIEIRAIYPDKRTAQRFFTDPAAAAQHALSYGDRANVYCGAATRMRDSGAKKDVMEVPALWADCDDPKAVERLKNFQLRPTLIVETSAGRQQAWWLLKTPVLIENDGTVESIEGVLRGIADNLHSDPAVAEVARVMRVPGTVNLKRGEPCRLVYRDGPRYDLDDFTTRGLFQAKAAKDGHYPVVDVSMAPTFIQGSRNVALTRLAGTMRNKGMTPAAIAAGLLEENKARCAPPLPESEVRAIAASVGRYPGATGKEKPVVQRELVKPLDLAGVMSGKAEPIPWVIEPLLARGEGVVIAGESGIGKSWATADLTLSLASGGDFLYTLPVAGGPYRVMVVDLENSERLIRWRLRKLARGRSLTAERLAGLPIAYHCQPGLDIGDEADRVALFRAVEAFRPDWVIFDSLIRLHRASENDNAEMRDVFAQLSRVKEYGAGFVVNHHLRKPVKGDAGDDVRYRIRGASDVLAAVDQAWGLQRNDGDGFTIIHEKTRWDTPAANMTVTIEDVLDGEGVILVAAEQNRTLAMIVDKLLKEAGEAGVMRATMLDEAMKAGAGRKVTADKALTRELGRRYARRLVRKRGSARAGTRYWLADCAPEDAK